jgi:hypothetical protein
MLTPVRMMSIGAALFGRFWMKSTMPCGISRSARSAVVSVASSRGLGRRLCQSR